MFTTKQYPERIYSDYVAIQVFYAFDVFRVNIPQGCRL